MVPQRDLSSAGETRGGSVLQRVHLSPVGRGRRRRRRVRGMERFKKRARSLRASQTSAESKLWFALRNRRLARWKFRRQHPIEGYIVDFVCIDAQLVVELDGGQHGEMRGKDAVRTEKIEHAGYVVVRFWNHDVIGDVDAILAEIDRMLSVGA